MKNEACASESLVSDCRSGDVSSARQLYEQYSKAMYNICLRMMNNVQDAEDMLQESFYQVFKNIENYRGEATIGAWIKRIVINKCLNQLKKKNPVFVEADNLEFLEEEPLDEQNFTYTVENIKKAIEKLPDGYRIVLSLYLFENYSHKEIADQLNISLSTAKTQYMRAKKKVREMVVEDSF